MSLDTNDDRGVTFICILSAVFVIFNKVVNFSIGVYKYNTNLAHLLFKLLWRGFPVLICVVFIPYIIEK